MDTHEIDIFMKKFKYIGKKFLGAFPSNYLENINLKKHQSIILNSCKYPQHSLPCHWTVLINTGESLYFFDSEGSPSYKNNPDIIRFIGKHKKRVFYNKIKIQDNKSLMCGYFSCIFIALFYKLKKIPQIKKYFFTLNIHKNDDILNNFLKYCN